MILAFYGTLMERGRRGAILRYEHLGYYGGPCVIRGDLYDVSGAFPALLPGDGQVRGQLWYPYRGREAAALGIFDSIEGYHAEDPVGSLYLRREVELLRPAGLRAFVYVWNASMSSLTPIPGGDWARRMAA